MSTTPRVPSERKLGEGHDEYIVAFVGLRQRLRPNAIGILKRCEVKPVEIPTPSEASRVFKTISPDAVVVDSRHPELQRMAEPALLLLREAEAETGSADRLVPIIVLSSAGLSAAVRTALVGLGAVLLPGHHQSYRLIAATVRRLCGRTNPCCAIGDLPESCFNASAIAALRRRH